MSVLAATAAAPTESRRTAADSAYGDGRLPVTPPDFLVPLLQRPVAIFGGGVSGRAVRSLLGALGVRSEVFDEKPGVGAAGGFTTVAAAAHGLVVFSPGFPPEHAWLRTARAAGATCLGELDFAALFWRGRVIAITGTNGKTTLAEFLAHALINAGEDAYAVGNIGFPLSRLVAFKREPDADAIAVCEVSSFQAETLQHFRAGATLWTNFAEDHLERHPGLEAYFAAKWNLVARTSAGAVFAGSSVQRYARQFNRLLPAAAGVPSEGAPPDPQLAGTVFARYPQRENFLLAQAWWQHEGRPEAGLYAAARSFRLGQHRLTRIGELHGISFWNDSKATNFHAVEAALAAFAGPVHLIAGGRSKGGDLDAFVHRVAPRIRHAWLIGETRAILAAGCAAHGVPHTVCGSLEEAVRGAYAAAGPGDHIVLSPAFASFDMFRSYADRGEQFEKLVNNLGTTSTFQ
ncbi:MAG TPA: UDP-N-acetylmuramoyl-L-alanine--D-glutamate ligase [Opitutaceae bacterium]|nr:UDP-N-acetylmuramoyl-L-alanine--D-glutamate ligase [Opitutaceae bacterium]